MTSIIVGLGNVGDRYVGTRHNVGFEIVGLVARELNAREQPAERLYHWATADSEHGRLVLAWPTTFMNRSGFAVSDILQRFPAAADEILVVTDDFNLPLGRIRIRPGGSDGGQKGLRSVAQAIETEGFPRLRVGIGPLPTDADPVHFVLSAFTPPELEIVQKTVAVAAKAVIFATRHPISEVMAQFNNTNPALPE